jgi:hypothetical protein
MKKEKSNWGWFRLGGFRQDPALTKKDKDWYEKELTKKKAQGLSLFEKLDEREWRLGQQKIKEKDANWLGRWLHKFSIEGDFWVKEKVAKVKDKDWL